LAGLLSIFFFYDRTRLRSETDKIDPIWSVKFPIKIITVDMQNIKGA